MPRKRNTPRQDHLSSEADTQKIMTTHWWADLYFVFLFWCYTMVTWRKVDQPEKKCIMFCQQISIHTHTHLCSSSGLLIKLKRMWRSWSLSLGSGWRQAVHKMSGINSWRRRNEEREVTSVQIALQEKDSWGQSSRPGSLWRTVDEKGGEDVY